MVLTFINSTNMSRVGKLEGHPLAMYVPNIGEMVSLGEFLYKVTNKHIFYGDKETEITLDVIRIPKR